VVRDDVGDPLRAHGCQASSARALSMARWKVG
jgi:hypothetical protein